MTLSTHTPPLPRRTRLVLAAILAVVVFSFAPRTHAQGPDPAIEGRAMRATVFLMQTYESAGTQVLSCVGSGTLISSNGLILTNAHLAQAAGPCRGERIVVALPVRIDEPPVPTYVAEAIQIDNRFDLAVLQITGGLDGSLVDPGTLNLPSVPVGEMTTLQPGSGMMFVGYPDVQATSVSSTIGVVTGLTTEKDAGSAAWLRTDSTLGGGMAGGGAFDFEGNLIGVSTSAPSTSGSDPGPDCLSVQDDSRDGLIDSRDTCVPIAQNVTAFRPIVFAKPLIDAALTGLRLDHASGTPEAAPAEGPTVTRLLFAPDVSATGVPTEVVNTLPSGANSLFVLFDHANLLPGTSYELRITRDGQYMPQLSLGPLAWGGKRNGTWYIGTEGKTLQDGEYEATIYVAGQPLATATVNVGAAPAPQSFTGLSFSVPGASSGLPSTSAMLPAGLPEVDATFAFDGMLEGQAWTEVWYLDGSEVFRETRLWDRGRSGETAVSASNVAGLPLGTYRLELLIGERLAATGDLTLAGQSGVQGTPSMFSAARIASDITRDGTPAGQVGASGLRLPLDTRELYAFFDWDVMPHGILWTYRWFLDGRIVASSTQPWNAGSVGRNFWVSLSAIDTLPEGEYTVEVMVEGVPMFSASAAVGSGTQPISGRETEADEVMIAGHVVDALTGEGISGALVAVLDVALESPSFTWNESEFHTQATSDRTGAFSLPRGLARGSYYTVYVFAEGYTTVVEDTFIIPSDQPSPTDIRIEMSPP